jgi:D-3-phosphoglycerate dehydrogenase
MKALAVGDSYITVDAFRTAFDPLQPEIPVEYLELDETLAFEATTPSEKSIREYAGSPRQIAGTLTDHSVLVVHGAPVTKEVIDAGTGLKLIGCARGGPVNVDVAAATARGIPVVTSPGKNAESVADLTLAFMIMLARGVMPSMRFLQEGGELGRSTFEGARWFGHDLTGHTLGLVGFGAVARLVSARARAFGMRVVAFDPVVPLPTMNGLGVEFTELKPLLEESDHVSVHARATKDNANMFGAAEFGLMKGGAFFINTARESLVDEDALFAAVADGHLGGAALDVVKSVPGGGPHPLLKFGNVVITPHIGGATYDTSLRGTTMLADEMRRLVKGQPLRNVINRQALGRR